MLIRPLTTIEDCRRVAALERVVWAYSDLEDVVPPPVLIVSIKRGGILLGAFEGDELKGFVYSLPGIKDGRPTQWSHMLGVMPDARAQGLGLRLKLAQRERALEMGLDLIEWTYDPLQAPNAHLNFARLGVVVEEYEENIYGDSSSVLHSGTPTDRFVAEWHIRRPHVERRIHGAANSVIRDSGLSNAPVVNPSRLEAGHLRPGRADLTLDARRVLVEIPTTFTEMLVGDRDLALDWRLTTRAIFQHYFGHGYRVVDFFRSRDVGQYLLVKRDGFFLSLVYPGGQASFRPPSTCK